MDNRGIPARINSRISRIQGYVALQEPSEGWPFGGLCEYTPIMNLSCQVPLSIRRGKQFVEAPEPSSRRIYTEAENVADENNRETPIVISSGSEGEDDSEDDAAIANVGNIGNDSAIYPVMELANVSHCPNEGAQAEDGVRAYEEARQRKGKMAVSASKAEAKPKGKPAAPEIPSGLVIREQQNGTVIERESDSETDSEDDAAIEHRRQVNVPVQESLNTQNGEAPELSTRRKNTEVEDAVDENNRGAETEYQRQLQVAIQESLNTQNVEAPELSRRREVENVVDENNLGAEYDREFEVAILESLNTHALQRGAEYDRQMDVAIMESLNTHALWREHELLKEGVTGSESVAAEGKFISNIEPTESVPRPPVSSRGRTVKPTVKQRELSSATGAPLPSKRKRKDGVSIDRQTKQKAVRPTPAVPRFKEGNITLNRRPRGVLRTQGVADVSEPRSPGSVVGQASVANGMVHQADVVNPNGSGAGVEVGVPEPSGSGSFVGQASRANGVTRQADVVDPNESGAGVEVGVSEQLLEPMVCVTNRNPMDLTIEEGSTYIRSENRVTSTHKVKLFGTYIS